MKTIFILSITLFAAARLPAAIVYFRLPEPFNASIGARDTELGYDRLPLDFNGDGNPEFVITAGDFFIDVLHYLGSRVFIQSSPPPNIGGSAASIQSGVEINAALGDLIFRWYGGTRIGGYDDEPFDRATAVGLSLGTGIVQRPSASAGHTRGKDGYIGLEFRLAGEVHYGWVHLDASGLLPDRFGELQGGGGPITGWAWETTPGKGIVAGAIPEPTTACLTFIAGGMVLLRRRRVANH